MCRQTTGRESLNRLWKVARECIHQQRRNLELEVKPWRDNKARKSERNRMVQFYSKILSLEKMWTLLAITTEDENVYYRKNAPQFCCRHLIAVPAQSQHMTTLKLFYFWILILKSKVGNWKVWLWSLYKAECLYIISKDIANGTCHITF